MNDIKYKKIYKLCEDCEKSLNKCIKKYDKLIVKIDKSSNDNKDM
jgi:hypothetical protein